MRKNRFILLSFLSFGEEGELLGEMARVPRIFQATANVSSLTESFDDLVLRGFSIIAFRFDYGQDAPRLKGAQNVLEYLDRLFKMA